MHRKHAHVPSSAVQTFKAGTRLVVENDSSSRKMYIIRSGKARVYKTYLGQRITLAVLGEGEVFGEMSFFDAEPRSASVEALTDLSAVVLDGEAARRELAGLPEWVYPIFRTVFHRFREMDSKITVLQSMSEFQKRAFKTDNVSKTIYLEVLRFIKTLRLLWERDQGARGEVRSDTLYAELDDVLGMRSIGLRVFWRMLLEHDFIDSEKESQGVIILNQDALSALNDYLVEETSQESFLLLSHTAVAILGKIVGWARTHDVTDGDGTQIAVRFDEIELDRLPLHEDGSAELVERDVLQATTDSFVLAPRVVFRLYTFQSILKAFDHTIISMD